MVPPPQKVIVMLDNRVAVVHPRLSQMDTVSGIIDYTAVVADSPIAGVFLSCSCASAQRDTMAENYIRIPPTISKRYGGEMIAFLAAEVKATAVTVPLEEHLPQVLLELVACAKHLGYVNILYLPPCRLRSVHRKSHIRGALTTGFKWHFVAVDLDTDGDGAKYWVSDLIEWRWQPGSKERVIEETSDAFDPALIAGILSSWVSTLGPAVSYTRVE